MNEFYLHDDEDVAVLTHQGQFGGIWARSFSDVLSHADEIHNAMIRIVKKSHYQNGNWVWIFKNRFEVVEGKKL